MTTATNNNTTYKILRDSAIILAAMTVLFYAFGYLEILGEFYVYGLDLRMFELSLMQVSLANLGLLLTFFTSIKNTLVILVIAILLISIYGFLVILQTESKKSQNITTKWLKDKLLNHWTPEQINIGFATWYRVMRIFAIVIMLTISILIVISALFKIGKNIANDDIRSTDGYISVLMKDESGLITSYNAKTIMCNDYSCAYLINLGHKKQVWIVSSNREKLAVANADVQEK